MGDFSAYMWSVPDWRTDEMYMMLDNREKGVFRELLDECWVTGSIPSDPQVLARIVREPPEYFDQVWTKIQHKFRSSDNGKRYYSARLEKDRRRFMLGAKFRIKKAKKAAKTRWDKSRQEREIHARSMPQASDEHQFEHLHTHTHNKEENTYTANSSTKYSDDFVCFWEESSKRGSKWEAFKIWRRIPKDIRPKVLEAMKAAVCGEWSREEPRYVPHVFRWLSQRRWEVSAQAPQPRNPTLAI